MSDIFTPDEGDPIVVAVDAEGGPFRRAEFELAGGVTDEDDKKQIQESIDSLFEGVDVSADFRTKMAVVFEAAVGDVAKKRLAEQAAFYDAQFTKLEEAHEQKLQESNAEFEAIVEQASQLYEERMAADAAATVAELQENLESYMEHAVQEWRNENAVAIESGIKVHMAESLMTGLKGLFEAHNIDVSEETVDTVAALEEELSEVRAKANTIMEENIRLGKQTKALMAESAFRDVAEGLTTVQAERLRTLSENLEVDNIDAFRTNVKTLRESFIRDAAKPAQHAGVETFIESQEPAPAAPQLNEHASIAALAEMIKNRRK